MLVALLIGVAAIAHAAWNITVKRVGMSGPSYIWAGTVLGAIVFAPFGIADLVVDGTDLLAWLPLAIVSGALQVVYFLVLQRGYRLGDVSVVYPLARGTGPLLAVVLAMVILGERPGWLSLLGALVITAGVVIIGLAGGRATAHANRAGIVYGLVVGVIIAVYTLWDSAAVTVHGMPTVGLYWGSVLVQAILLAIPSMRRWPEPWRVLRAHPVAVALFAILGPLAYILVLWAIQLSSVSVVAPAREVSVVLVGLAGWFLFREPHPVQRLIGSVVALVGVAVLALGS